MRTNPPQQSTIDAVKERLAEIAASARTFGVVDFAILVSGQTAISLQGSAPV
jgi:hypothetical protein